MSDSLNSQSHCFSRGKWEDGGGNWNEWELLVHLDVPSVRAYAVMRRIPPFLFIWVCGPWETAKIRLRPKVETLWVAFLFKGASPLSSYFFLSYLLSSPLDTFGSYVIRPRHFGLFPALTTTIRREYQLGTDGWTMTKIRRAACTVCVSYSCTNLGVISAQTSERNNFFLHCHFLTPLNFNFLNYDSPTHTRLGSGSCDTCRTLNSFAFFASSARI